MTSAAARPAPEPVRLPLATRLTMLGRMLAVQGSYNYEIMVGNGIGFCIEPALRLLPGGRDGAAYRDALARESRYFNAHPYLAAVAVGALARAELEQAPPERIDRFRTALCGPLGSVGDRLVWAGWLPFCSLLALVVFGLGAGPWTVVLTFLIAYNLGHLGLRAWGLEVGWTHGLRVASALGNPILRRGPPQIARAAAVLAGVALPLTLEQIIGPGRRLIGVVLVAIVLGSILLVRVQSRAEGWRVALGVLLAFLLLSVALSSVGR